MFLFKIIHISHVFMYEAFSHKAAALRGKAKYWPRHFISGIEVSYLRETGKHGCLTKGDKRKMRRNNVHRLTKSSSKSV